MAVGIAYVAIVFSYLAGGDDRQGVGRTLSALTIAAGLGAGTGGLIDWVRRRPLRRVIYDVQN
jgi:hypothetical protein